jgi:hypothetical protein
MNANNSNPSVKEMVKTYSVQEIRAQLDPMARYVVRNTPKEVWALRLWKERNPKASIHEQVQQMQEASK